MLACFTTMCQERKTASTLFDPGDGDPDDDTMS